jgi:hypothetical protein
MEFLLIVGGIWFVYWLYSRRDTSSSRSQTYTPSSRASSQTTTRRPAAKDPRVYRPRQSSSTRPKIQFNDTGATPTTIKPPSAQDLKDLHDAFTGEPLDLVLGLYQCSSCKVYYHTESYEVLREENRGQCVACSSTNIVALTGESAKGTSGRDHNPNVITLDNFRSHVGRVIVFEGHVHNVLKSRRGKDYAIMFENKSWTKGFKLVFFRGAVQKVGGSTYINGLKGKTVRVRGLLINHDTFGYEIIVSEKSMILSARR